MAGGEELGSRLLKIVQQAPDCDVDSLAAHCPEPQIGDTRWVRVRFAGVAAPVTYEWLDEEPAE